jgi:hypothetical protein
MIRKELKACNIGSQMLPVCNDVNISKSEYVLKYKKNKDSIDTMNKA